MSAPTTYTISFLQYSGASPAVVTVGTASLSIPADYTSGVQNFFRGGGVWITVANVLTFIPWSMVVQVTAQ